MKKYFIIIICLTALKLYAQDTLPVSYFNFVSHQQSIRMAYVYQKPNNPNGKTVILLHGKNFSHLYWQEVINKLLEKGIQF
jgi:hypothetical protein